MLLKRLSIIMLVMFCCVTEAVSQTTWDNLTVEQKAELLKKMPPEELNFIQNEMNKPSYGQASREYGDSLTGQTSRKIWDSLTVQEKAELMKKLLPQEQRQIQNQMLKSPDLPNTETSWEALSRQQKSDILNKLSPDEQQFLKNTINKTSSSQSFSQSLTRQQQIEMMKKLSPEEQRVLEKELKRSTQALTPEALDELQKSPQFKGLMAEDILRGREMLVEKGTPFNLQPERLKTTSRKTDEKRFEETDFRKQPDEKESTTLFQRTRKIGKYQDISLDLQPFGYDFFKDTSIRLLTERKDIPVPANYVIGPGDQVKILFWGRVNAQYSLTVDRNGSITIPEVGPLYVAGMTFEQMSTRLIQQSSQMVGANIDVTMGSLKTIPIFVTGDVRWPGAYMIGSFAKITDALLIAGGPSEIGTMRNIQLKRKNKIVATFDLYDFLLKGDKTHDTVLQADDVIFVPVSGPQVGVAGNVKRPAIYELKDKTELSYLLEVAGGIVPTAYTQQIQIERIVKNEKQIIVDIDDKKLTKAGSVHLLDSDLVKIFPIVEADANVVYLQGHVKRPGKYEMKPHMKLREVIKNVDELLPEPYLDYALIKRSYPQSQKPQLIPFHLGNLLDGSDKQINIELKPKDEIYIFSARFFKDRPTFTVRGEVRNPNKYEFVANSKVKDALLAAGGLTKDAYREQAQILRMGNNRQYESIIYFNVAGALEGNVKDNVLLNEDDVITIRSLSDMYYKQTVTISGAVAEPGKYEYTKDMTVKDLVFAAGNVLESAYLERAELSSQVTQKGAKVETSTININLRSILYDDYADDPQLKPHDTLFIRSITDWGVQRHVTVSGQVRFAGKYLLHKGEKISSLIERAGGYLDNAYLRGSRFTRESVRLTQQKSIEDMALRMERDLLIGGSEQLSRSLSAEEFQAKRHEIDQKQKLVETIRNVKSIGRMTVKIEQLDVFKSSKYDIELEDGDQLMIPEKSSAVGVIGSVMGQGTHVFLEGDDYLSYINRSGGFSEYADASKVFVLKVDGTAVRAKSGWFDSSSGSELVEIEPGDVIVVPEKVERIAWLREIRDITQILMNTAVAAGVVIKLF